METKEEKEPDKQTVSLTRREIQVLEQFVAKEKSRYAMDHVEVSNGEVRATDGRMALVLSVDCPPELTALIPMSGLGAARRLSRGKVLKFEVAEEDELTVTRVTVGRTEIVAKQEPGKYFPPINQAVPSPDRKNIRIGLSPSLLERVAKAWKALGLDQIIFEIDAENPSRGTIGLAGAHYGKKPYVRGVLMPQSIKGDDDATD